MWCLVAGFFPLSAAASIYLYRQPPLSQSQIHQVTQLRTDFVHCREFAGTVPEVLKVVPVTGAAFSSIILDQLMYTSLFPRPLWYVVGMCDKKVSIGGCKEGDEGEGSNT